MRKHRKRVGGSVGDERLRNPYNEVGVEKRV